MMDSDLSSDGGFNGDQPYQGIPPGYWLNPATGQIEPVSTQGAGAPASGGTNPIPTNQDGSQVGSGTPWAPGASAPSSAPPGYHWDANLAMFQPDAPGSNTPPAGDGGSGPAAAPQGTLTGLLAPYQGSFTAPTPTAYPTAPTFTPPTYTPPPAFVPDQFSAPTYADAQNDPGYKFAADEGERSLTQGAAAKGLLNTGGTLKDILAWGQNYAAQRYGDVYNRNYNTFQGNEGAKERAYATNYSSQFLDPYKFAYQGALDTFNPQQSQWQTNMAATQRGNENDYANAYNLFNFDYNKFKDQRDSTFNKTFQYVTA